ncbi:hypothetical protein ACWC9S_06215 [Streptomyces xiamenensis]
MKVPEEPLLFARTGVLSGWWESGLCLMCRREGVPVIWLGPVIHGARHAPFYSCETCTGWLVRYVGTHDHDAPPPAPSSSPAPVAELGLRYVVAALGVLTVAGAVGSLWLAFSGRPP